MDTDEGTQTGSMSTGPTYEDVMPGERASLVVLEAWVRADGEDPFGPAPADATCEVGFGEEGGLFEIDSELCTWGTFEQPSLATVREGDEVELVLVHDQLYSEDPEASAFLGLSMGEEVVWSQEIPIPAEAGFLRPTFVATQDHPIGTMVRFHVHNHGVNNYRFVDLKVSWASG